MIVLKIQADRAVNGTDKHPVAMGHLFLHKQKWFVQLASDKKFPGHESMLHADSFDPKWYSPQLGVEHCSAFLKYVSENTDKVPRHGSIAEALESAISILKQLEEAGASFYFCFDEK